MLTIDYRYRRAGVLAVIFLAGCAGSGAYQSPVTEQGTSAPRGASVPRDDRPPSAPVSSPAQLPSVPAGQPVEPPPVPRVGRAPVAQPPAVVALLDRAEQQANTGDLDAAAVTLERAIRIDPRNPVLWHHLATIRLAEGEPTEAEQLAAKSNSLAAGNQPLQARNWELIAQARHARGDAAGARAAEQRARGLGSR
jgi:tetratricopeptide (TPR) repeat protein